MAVDQMKNVESNEQKFCFEELPEREIGIVRYFNALNGQGFGSIVTVEYCPTLSQQDTKPIFFHLRECDCLTNVKSGDWITFTRVKGQVRDAAPLAYDKHDLSIALCYRGNSCKIFGKDEEKGKYYNEYIFHHIASHMIGKNDGLRIVLETISEFISGASKDCKQQILFDLQKDSNEWIRHKWDSAEAITLYYSIINENININDINIIKSMHSCFDSTVKDIAVFYNEVIDPKLKNDQNTDFSFIDSFPDAIKIFLYLNGGDRNLLEKISNTENLISVLKSCKRPYLVKVLTRLLSDYEGEEHPLLRLAPAECLAEAVKTFSESEQYRIIGELPESLAFAVVPHLSNIPSVQAFVQDKWESRKSEVPYVVFDLEISVAASSGKRNIRQFAFRKENNTRTYDGEEQLNSLKRALSKADIVVGHHIRQWDLPILDEKGISTTGFVWDTLEMEILLAPCRYAYALHTTHDAKGDTELTDKLFWNQLYRISQNPELSRRLSNFLPDSLNGILSTLSEPLFAKFFEMSAQLDTQFFQEKIPLDEKLELQLKQIAEASSSLRTLIVAPRILWPRLALYLPLTFHHTSTGVFDMISEEKVRFHPLSDPLKQAVLLRFCEECRTPLVSNLATYLRIPTSDKGEGLSRPDKIYFSEEVLTEYLCECSGAIDCIDMEAFGNEHLRTNKYDRIYVIGEELQDRLHKQLVSKSWTHESLLEKGCHVAFHMGANTFARLDDRARESLGIAKEKFIENIWAERQNDGSISIFQNYKYKAFRQSFLDSFAAKPKYIEWKLSGQRKANLTPCILRSHRKDTFSSADKRLSSGTAYRAAYWVSQFSLLQDIHRQHPSMPIIYVVDGEQELEPLENYAAALGFYVPKQGSRFRRLEHIGDNDHGLIIISKHQFKEEISTYRVNRAFCYVWDSLDLDLYLAAWTSPPFDDAVFDSDEEKEDKETGITSRQCIIGLWPVYEHYYSLIKANCKDSCLYLIDAHFDDHSDLSPACKADFRECELWKDEESYANALEVASQFFDDLRVQTSSFETEHAMMHIRQMFLPNGSDWRDSQPAILKHMLEKKGDCVISMPTGGGKSVLFQGPAIYRGALSRKLTLVVGPLRALMQDQVEELNSKGFAACVDYLNGDRAFVETQQIYRRIRSGDISLLFITPERFRVESFEQVLQERMEKDGGLEYIVFDEAHCITQWGNEFRPEYKNALQSCSKLKARYNCMIALFSATITNQEEHDFRKILPDLTRLGHTAEAYNPVRSHIGIDFQHCGHDLSSRLDAILNYIEQHNIDFNKSCMLIFCRVRKVCEELSELLEARCVAETEKNFARCAGHIGYYHAGMTESERDEVYQKFKSTDDDRIYILCTTKAFGMGMDIPNVHYLVHYSPPSILEDYLQEVGRAGRNHRMYEEAFPDGSKIPALCLCSTEDFGKLKELLIKSQLAWSDLRECKKSIMEYIERFRDAQKETESPVVVPFDIWIKDESSLDTTATLLVFQWLEEIGHIRRRYYKHSHLDLTLKNVSVPNLSILGAHISLYQYLLKKIEKKEQPSQIAMQDLRNCLQVSLPQLVNGLLLCESKGLLTLNETMRCTISTRRASETRHMLSHRDQYYALRIIMEAARKVLRNCKRLQPFTIDKEYRKSVIREVVEGISIPYVKDNDKGKDILYMPWKNELPAHPPFDIIKAETFKKGIYGRGIYWVFLILSMIPDVSFRNEKNEQYVTIKSDAWKSFLDEFERDCMSWLSHIKDVPYAFNWSAAIKALGFTVPHKGFAYFQNILSVLKRLGYIEHTSPLRNGVEMFATTKSWDVIDEGENVSSPMHVYRQLFDELESIKKVRLACMNIFSDLANLYKGDDLRKKLDEFIRRYFQSSSLGDYIGIVESFVDPNKREALLAELNEVALKQEEDKLNGEQLDIYKTPKDVHVSVQAGPGSGKTHVLTLRCARLIYREKVEPSHILVLAYNRAVVVELKNRLNTLFTRLGLSKSAHQLHIHTFHALAKKCLGTKLEGVDTSDWEGLFLDFVKTQQSAFKAIFPQIEYVLVDEFQDVTQSRLDCLLCISKMFPRARFFTIGDMNQSIYGFDRVGNTSNLSPEEYAERLSPRPYYEQLEKALCPVLKTMRTNYRSYQKILDAAAPFATNSENLPMSAEVLMRHEPQKDYVFMTDCSANPENSWDESLRELVAFAQEENSSEAKHRHINEIAVFFRTNAEVYAGYSRIKDMFDSKVRIRIQGAETAEFWRKKEVFAFLRNIGKKRDLVLNEDWFARLITYTKERIEDWQKKKLILDSYNLDIIHAVILDYRDSIRSDEEAHTFGDLIEYIKEVATGKDGQLFKIYEQHKSQVTTEEEKLTIVLTTMHKVKGLEFDAVMIPASSTNLPMRAYCEGKALQADIEEERRLRYVACTRAKKYLHIFLDEREKALDKHTSYTSNDTYDFTFFESEPSLKNYVLSYNAKNFIGNLHFNHILTKDPIFIKRDNWGNFDLYWNNMKVGRLSSSSTIARKMKRNNVYFIDGFFVNDIIAYTYDDSLHYDKMNGTNFTALWKEEAKEEGYIYIVDIAGIGKPN